MNAGFDTVLGFLNLDLIAVEVKLTVLGGIIEP